MITLIMQCSLGNTDAIKFTVDIYIYVEITVFYIITTILLSND